MGSVANQGIEKIELTELDEQIDLGQSTYQPHLVGNAALRCSLQIQALHEHVDASSPEFAARLHELDKIFDRAVAVRRQIVVRALELGEVYG